MNFKGFEMIKKYIYFYIFLIICLIASPSQAEKLNVAYGGVFTAGNENYYRNYLQLKNKFNINVLIANILRELNEGGKFNFNLLLETDAEMIKYDINLPCTFALVITRDDCITEKFEMKEILVYKNIINIGISAIFYQTEEIDNDGTKENKHNIVFSVPITGYILNLEGKKQVTEDELLEMFKQNLIKIVREKLPQRLSKITLGKIVGNIKEIKRDTVKLDVGFRNGLFESQYLYFYKNDKKIGRGKIIKLDKDESIVKIENKTDEISQDCKAVTVNVKGTSEENYQITQFKITSKKAKEFFVEEETGPQVSQWLTDYLFYNGGKTMMPTKVSNNWISESLENSYMVLVKDSISYTFEIAKPKNEIKVELTGLTSKVTDSNKINTEKIFKIWMKIIVPQKKYEQEFDFSDVKIIVNDVQEYSDKDIFFEMLNKISAKIGENAKNF